MAFRGRGRGRGTLGGGGGFRPAPAVPFILFPFYGYKDKELQAKKVKPPLCDVIELGTDHMPAELAKGQTRRVKKLKWTAGQELNNLFDKFQNKDQGLEGAEKKENEGEEEEEEGPNEEDEGEFSDAGDYEQAEYFDDDEDDYNMADDNDNEPSY